MRRLLIAVVCASLMVGTAHAQPDKADVIRAIIGEAAGEIYTGQLAVACAIKNRPEGLHGVYGAQISRKPSHFEQVLAEEAYLSSQKPLICEDLIHGADMWHSNWPTPESWMGVPMVFIKQIGNHWFYRRITEGYIK